MPAAIIDYITCSDREWMVRDGDGGLSYCDRMKKIAINVYGR